MSCSGIYREVFFAHNGPGPYICHFCGKDVSFEEVLVHHEDEDKSNDNPSNLEAAHQSCHIRHHKTGWKPDKDTRQKCSESAKRQFEDPDQRRKVGDRTRGRKDSAETRRKKGVASHRMWERRRARSA